MIFSDETLKSNLMPLQRFGFFGLYRMDFLITRLNDKFRHTHLVRRREARKSLSERKICFGTLSCSIKGKNGESWKGYSMEENNFLSLNNINNKLFQEIIRLFVDLGFCSLPCIKFLPKKRQFQFFFIFYFLL